jgi:PAS domain S-box-containing protein
VTDPAFSAGMRRALSGEGRLARRLILLTVVFSGTLALVISAVHVAMEYRRDVDEIEQRFDVIEKSYLPSISESAWLLDREQLRILLQGIKRLPDLSYVEVTHTEGRLAASGEPGSAGGIARSWTLTRNYRGSDVVVGELNVQASLAGPRARILSRAGYIAATNIAKTLLVAAFMFFLVWWLVTRHLERIAAHVSGPDPVGPARALVLERPRSPRIDEFDRLVEALNDMATQIRASQEGLRLAATVFESAVEGIVVTDPRSRILAVNTRCLEITGYPAAEVLGQTPRIWRSGRHDKSFYRDMWRSILEKGGWSGEIWNRRKDGCIRPEWVSISAVLGHDGNVTHFIGMYYDLTGRIAAEQALRESERRRREDLQHANAELEVRVAERTALLEAANSDLKAFSYTVSHDLRAPLRHISGYLGMLGKLQSVSNDSEALRYAEVASNAAVRLGRMVDELLRYAQLGHQPMQFERVDLAMLIASLRRELESLQEQRRVEWIVGELPAVRGDATLLRLAFQNLLDNALKFTRGRDPARIEVSANADAAEVTVRVRDNGVGFDARYAGKLFGAFERMHTENQFPGTGIGLAHVKRIVERHGGHVRFEAAPQEGAAFFVTIPL